VTGTVLGIDVGGTDVLIVAGGMAHAGPPWWDLMNAGIAGTAPRILPGVRATAASLDDDVAIIGAAKGSFDAQGPAA